MKKIKIFICIFFVLFNTVNAKIKILDKIVAIVNNKAILLSDVKNFSKMEQKYMKNTKKILNKYFYKNIIEKLIINNIFIQIIEKNNLKIQEEQIDQFIINTAYRNNIPVYVMLKILKKNGINYAMYRNQIKKDFQISIIHNSLSQNKITIKKEEINSLIKKINEKKNEYFEFDITHFLFPILDIDSKSNIEKQKILAQKMIFYMKNKIDFLNKKNIFSKNMNVLNFFSVTTNELPSLFFNFLKNVKNGDIIGPIKSNAGFHILKINNISDKNQKIFLLNLHLKNIVIKHTTILNRKAAYKKILDIYNAIKFKKISFFLAAQKYSEDIFSSIKGGDIGWNSIDKFDNNIQKILFSLKTNEISKPFRSSIGWHIIKLINKKPLNITKKIEKQYVKNLLINKKLCQIIDFWIQEQRNNSYIKILKNDI